MQMDKSKGEKMARYVYELGLNVRDISPAVLKILKNEESVSLLEEVEGMERLEIKKGKKKEEGV